MMKRLRRARAGERGFTLIETLIAIVVMGIAVGTLLVVLSAVVEQTVAPEIHSTGSRLLEREFERVTAERFSAVASEASTPFPAPYSAYSFAVAVSPVPSGLATDPGMSEYKQVRVTVTHASGGSLGLSTVITNT